MTESGAPLSQKALGGSLYYSAFRWLDRIAQIVSGVVLARLLAPEHFGLVAMAYTVIGLLESLSELGLAASVIQRSDCDRQDYDVAWTYGRVLRGALLFVIMYLSAPWVSRFYSEPRIAPVLRVLAISELLTGGVNIGAYALLVKELNYRKDFYFSLTGKAARLLVVIPLALYLRNVWALIGGALAERLALLAMSYYIHPYRPRLNFNLKRTLRLLGFGGWLMGVQLVNTLRGSVDKAVLGRYLDSTSLGYYQTGTRFGGEVPTEVKTVVSKVMFPVYALMQNDRERIAAGFRQVFSLALFLSLPLSIGMVLVADHFVTLVLGPQWEPAITVIHILVLSGMIQVLIGMGYPLFRGTGRPKLEFLTNLTALVVASLLLVPATMRFGPAGTAGAVLAGNLCAMVLWWIFTLQVTGLASRDMLTTAWPPLAATLVMAGAVVAVRIGTEWAVSWPAFVGSVLAGILAYGACIWLAWRVLRLDVLERLVRQLEPYGRKLLRAVLRRA